MSAYFTQCKQCADRAPGIQRQQEEEAARKKKEEEEAARNELMSAFSPRLKECVEALPMEDKDRMQVAKTLKKNFYVSSEIILQEDRLTLVRVTEIQAGVLVLIRKKLIELNDPQTSNSNAAAAQGQSSVTALMGHLSMGSSASISRSIGHVQYVGVIQMIEGYHPPLTCREHMLNDLPGVLLSPKGTLAGKIPFIVDECARIAEDRLHRLPAGTPELEPNEALAVVSYTYDLNLNSDEDGEDNLFVVLNETLRKRNGPIMRVLKPYLTYLMRGLRALPEVRTTCFRGVPPDCLQTVLDCYTPGADVHWSAFTSCALHLDTAKQFAQKQGGIIFRIKILSARDLRAYSAFPQEQEVLLSPNVKLVVIGACNLGQDGYYYVDLQERCGAGVVF